MRWKQDAVCPELACVTKLVFVCAMPRRGRLNFCLTLLVMLVVGLTFAGVYVFIKATSFAGYRAARHAAPAPAPGPGGEL